jgi:hypothetical protein
LTNPRALVKPLIGKPLIGKALSGKALTAKGRSPVTSDRNQC